MTNRWRRHRPPAALPGQNRAVAVLKLSPGSGHSQPTVSYEEFLTNPAVHLIVRGHGMRLCASFLSAILASVPAWADIPCEAPRDLPDVLSTQARVLAPEQFSKITKKMTIYEILRRLGPPARDIGSGVYILEWDSTDGRVFSLSASSLCYRPLSMKFALKGASP